MNAPKYKATARDVDGGELYADVAQGPRGQVVRIVYATSHVTRVLARLNPADAAVLAQQLLHLSNVIRDHQAEGRRGA